MEKSTAIIDAQTSLLRELRETYVALRGAGYAVRVRNELNERDRQLGETAVAILRSIEKLALATLPSAPSVIATQQIEPPAAEICKVTHDVVRIRNERNGRPGWENDAAAFCGISPKRATEIWGEVIAEAYAKPMFAEADVVKPKLAIGQTWRTRSGEVGVIERKSVGRFFCRFSRRTVRSYDARGYYASGVSELDLTELISGDPPTE